MQNQIICHNNVFHITNDAISYLFFVNKERMLQHLYFGKRLDDFDVNSATELGFDWSKTFLSKDGKEELYEDNYYYDRSLMEVPSYGADDQRHALITATSQDGRHRTIFRFVSYRSYVGIPEYTKLPTLKNSSKANTLEITLCDEAKGLTLLLSYSIMDNYGSIIRSQKLVCGSPTIIDRAFSLSLDLPSSDYSLTHFSGDWSFERRLVEEKLEPGIKVIGTNSGRSSHEENPFFFVSDPGAGEENGEVYGFSFLYSGSWKGEIEVSKFHSTRVLLGINDDGFSFPLSEKEELELPVAVLSYSPAGFGPLSRDIHRLIREHIISFPDSYPDHPILINSWEACFMDFDTEKLMKFAVSAKEIGADLFVLDDGWFGKRNDDSSSLGDWTVNDGKVHLGKLISCVHGLGMKFGLWFEPEMINPDSNLYRNHPEFILANPLDEPGLSRHQLQLDLTNPKVIDYLFESIEKILKEYQVDYVKWDHNRPRSSIYSPFLGSKREGEIEYRSTVGYYNLLSRLTKAHPDILFEGCASGGGRFDLGQLSYTPQIWTSDETDPVQRLFIQYSTSFGYPLIAMGTHISKSPVTNYTTKGEIALFGTFGIELDPTTLKKSEVDEIIKLTNIYRSIARPLIEKGDLYRLRNPYKDNAFSFLVMSQDKTSGAFLYVNLLKENARYRFVKLRGLKASSLYSLSGYKRPLSGDYLMNVGINLYGWLSEFESRFIELKEVSR